jgi:hypothetical protein
VLSPAALLSGLRRLFVFIAVLFGVTCAVSLGIGALAHANLERALADGFYVVGVAVLIGSFILGIRGPLRADWGEGEEDWSARPVRFLPGFMPRMIRRTTADERVDARRSSLGLFALGLAFILIGAGFDPSRNAF